MLAGPLEDFYALEDQMIEAHDEYALDREASESGKEGKPADRTGPHRDRRPEILKKMDALTVANIGKPEALQIAVGTFMWSWNLDLDLEHLSTRFRRLVEHYTDDPVFDEVLPAVGDAGAVAGKPEEWVRILDRLISTTKRDRTRLGAMFSLGRINLATGKLSEAKTAFKAALKLSAGGGGNGAEEESDLAEAAKGYLFEIDHLQVGMKAPDFVVKTLDGRELSLQSLRGKVVLLNFWATWCPTCISEIPYLQAAASRLKNKPFEILAVSLDDAREMLVAMVKSMKIPGIHTWDEAARGNHVAKLYNAVSLPTWYLLDKEGVIRARDPFGDALIPSIEALLGSGKTESKKADATLDRRTTTGR